MGPGACCGECAGPVDVLAIVELDNTAIERRRSALRSDGHDQQQEEYAMNESLKVQRHHLERGAYLYIRQSSMRQVLENVESTKRQYALRGRATALGWPDDKIIVIDADQGESGASATWREGFQRLVTDVGMGRAGIVMGLEVSRLARNNADWHRLLEICALADTLILDEDGVYDPANFNDRLLLGLKGTMSEAELHVLKARLRGGILNKVRRGEYRCPLPTGFLYNEAGEVVLDPDSQIRETIVHFFETFSRVGSAAPHTRRSRRFTTRGFSFHRVFATAVPRSFNRSRRRQRFALFIIRDMQASTSTAGVTTAAPLTAENPYASVNAAIGSHASPTLTRATSRGTSFKEISNCSRTTIEGSRSPVRRRRVKEWPCCRGERCAGGAVDISA
jgi:DNA invertase Pin-like site-specific DNA recombinase